MFEGYEELNTQDVERMHKNLTCPDISAGTKI